MNILCPCFYNNNIDNILFCLSLLTFLIFLELLLSIIYDSWISGSSATNLDLGTDWHLFARSWAARKRHCRGNERARFIIRDADTLRLSPEVVLQEGWRRQREGERGERTRCEEEAEQKGERGVNGKSGRKGTAWINTITRGWLTTRSPWQEGERQREITTPLLVIEIIRCQHSTSFTMPTFSLPLSSFARPVLLVSCLFSLFFFSLYIPDFRHPENTRILRQLIELRNEGSSVSVSNELYAN